ncbi:MAG: Cys-Xaa-Xaa-Xaa repeat radical SAM target protein [Bacteroidales bacterium]|nr:Cys-Xaa-Xaa-Xaa repeat radical SAM target protein [Bacteroidales bacterium]
MEKENKKEEIQSRREFFKNAAKKGLPIVAAAMLASTPLHNVQAATSCTDDGCMTTCTTGCLNTCLGTCKGNCYSTCKGTCSNTCSGGCRGNNKHN